MNISASEYARDDTIAAIVQREWSMFQRVNEGNGLRASCQDNFHFFDIMRSSQFKVWSQDAAEAYLSDLIHAEATGRNLLTEKYVFMMIIDSSSLHEAYFRLVKTPTDRSFILAETILQLLMRQSQDLRMRYPCLGHRGRPLLTGEEGFSVGGSVQTYQMGELLTYSETTLACLFLHIEHLEANGLSTAEMILLNEVRSCGYASLEEAEMAVRQEEGLFSVNSTDGGNNV
jgi:hypothetical protein